MPPDPTAVRDAALERVSRLTRWALAGSLALTAGFSVVAARVLPGRDTRRAVTARTTSPSVRQSDPGVTSPPGTTAPDDAFGQFQAPSSPPAPSDGPGDVVSGGS